MKLTSYSEDILERLFILVIRLAKLIPNLGNNFSRDYPSFFQQFPDGCRLRLLTIFNAPLPWEITKMKHISLAEVWKLWSNKN
jgi:hypothetical protein